MNQLRPPFLWRAALEVFVIVSVPGTVFYGDSLGEEHCQGSQVISYVRKRPFYNFLSGELIKINVNGL